MRYSHWLKKIALGMLSAAVGCTSVPTEDTPSWLHAERPSPPPLVKRGASSVRVPRLSSSDEDSPGLWNDVGSRRDETAWSRAPRNANGLLSEDLSSLEPTAGRKVVARKAPTTPRLAGELGGNPPRKKEKSRDEGTRQENSIRLAEGLTNDVESTRALHEDENEEAPLRTRQEAARRVTAATRVDDDDENDFRQPRLKQVQAEAEVEEGRSLPTPPPPAGTETRDVFTDSFHPELPVGYALSLGNALSLADSQNPNVAFARERINEAYARVDRASVLWLPSIRSGLNYVHHEGMVQDVIGNMQYTQKSSLYGGLGSMASGGGNPAIPGVAAQFHLTDAIFQPKIAEYQASSRQFGARAVRNDVLRNAAVSYLELVRAEQSLAIAEEALTNTRRLVKLTGEYARTGQGLRSDNERMLAEQAIRESDVVTRVEGVRVTSARLAQVLHVDPSVRISSGEPMIVPLDLVERDAPASEFVIAGLQRRPELAEQKHLVQEAVQRLNREKFAPLVPSVLLGFSYGSMGGGLGNQIIKTNDRLDADAMAFWEVRNFGFGEHAARKEMSSLVRQANHRKVVIMDAVAREVVEAHSQMLERERRIGVAKQGITSAERSFRLNEERIENAQGLPIESLQAVQALAATRQNYLNAVIDYNIAQFELCRAIGWFDGDSKAGCAPDPAGLARIKAQ